MFLTSGGTRLLFAPNDTFTVLVVIGVAVALGLLFTRTSIGLQMRAAAFRPEKRAGRLPDTIGRCCFPSIRLRPPG